MIRRLATPLGVKHRLIEDDIPPIIPLEHIEHDGFEIRPRLILIVQSLGRREVLDFIIRMDDLILKVLLTPVSRGDQ